MSEQTFFGKNYKITYKFRSARLDKRKLVVIFSGDFAATNYYDFSGKSSDFVKSNILWIRDMFNGEFTYYIRDRSGFGLGDDIQDLISYYVTRLGISKRDVILMGFSKGGSAALYHGIKYDFKNIVSTVPRIKLGSANVERPKILNGLTADHSEQSIRELDQIIPNLILDDHKLDKNIYLYSSPQDPLFEGELREHLPKFEKYTNFNLTITESDLVRRHRDVTRYNLPNIIAVVNLLVDNITPRFGTVTNGNRDYRRIDSKTEESKYHICKTSSASLEQNHLYIAGHSFIRGLEPNDSNLSNTLILKDDWGQEYRYPLFHTTDLYLSYIYYQGRYLNYDRGGFSTRKSQGIDLSTLPIGDYYLSIEALHDDQIQRSTLDDSSVRKSWSVANESIYCLYSLGKVMRIRKYALNEPITATPLHFSLNQAEIDKRKLEIQGELVFSEATEASKIGYHRFKLIATNIETNEIRLFPLRRSTENLAIGKGLSRTLHPGAGFSTSLELNSSIENEGLFRLSIGLLSGSNYFGVPTGFILHYTSSGKVSLQREVLK